MIDDIATPRNQDVVAHFNPISTSDERVPNETISADYDARSVSLANELAFHNTAFTNLDVAPRAKPYSPEGYFRTRVSHQAVATR